MSQKNQKSNVCNPCPSTRSSELSLDSVLSTHHSVLSGPQHLFADVVVDLLRRGERVRFLAPGGSMYPTIRNNEVIGVEPVKPSQVKRGDIILYRTDRGVIAHRVVRIENERPFRASRSVSLKDRLREPRGAAFGLEARGAAYSLGSAPEGHPPRREDRPFQALRSGSSSLEDGGSSLKRSDPRTPACGRQEVLLKRSAPQTKCSLIKHSALSFKHSSLSPHCSALSTLFVLRGDASGTCDEPVEGAQILGKVVSVERDGSIIDLNSKRTRIMNTVGIYAYRLRRTIRSRIAALEDRPLRALRIALLNGRGYINNEIIE